MRLPSKLVLSLTLSALLLSSCSFFEFEESSPTSSEPGVSSISSSQEPISSSQEPVSSAEDSSSEEPYVTSHDFSNVDSGEGSYEYPDNSEGSSREPYSTSYEDESEEEESIPHASSSEEESSSSESSSSSSSSSSTITPNDVRYALTDLPTGTGIEDFFHVQDTAYFSALAARLAGIEIANLGFEVFPAFAVDTHDNEDEEDDTLISGLAFTNNGIYAREDNTLLYSCGFMQIMEKGRQPEELLIAENEQLEEGLVPGSTVSVSKGVFVYPKDDDGRRFVIESNAFLDGFSGVYMDTYFSYRQTSAFSFEIEVKPAQGEVEDYADERLDCYSYDEKEYLYKASLFRQKEGLGAYALYGTKAAEAYDKALEIIDQSIKLQEKEGVNIALNSFVLFSEDLYNNLSFDTQREEIQGRLADVLRNQLVAENQYIVLDYDETAKDFNITIATDYNYNSSDTHLANGIIKTITSLLMIAGGVTAIVATGGIAANPFVLGAMYATIGTALAYAGSELVAGITEAYYQDDEHIIDPILDGLKAIFNDEEMVEKVYHAVGIVSNIAVSFFAPISASLSASAVSGGVRTIASTALTVLRTVVIHAAKLVITVTTAKFVGRIAEDITLKLGASPAVARLVGFASSLITGILVYSTLTKIQNTLSGISKTSSVSQSEIDAARAEMNQHGDLNLTKAIRHIKTGSSGDSHSQLVREMTMDIVSDTHISTPVQVDYVSADPGYEFGMMRHTLRRASDGKLYTPRGTYDPATHRIYIFADKLDDNGAETLRTIAHLVRHAYQLENAEFNSPVEKGLREGAYESYSDANPNLLNPAEVDAKAYADYIVSRAYAANDAYTENPNLDYFENRFTFEDPSSFLAEVAS